MDSKNGCTDEIMQTMYFEGRIQVLKTTEVAKRAKLWAKQGKMEAKSTKSSILRTICHLEHYKSTNGQEKWLHKQYNTKYILYNAQLDCRGSGNFKTGQNLGKMEVKNTKSSILRAICHLEHCKSIKGQKKWLHKQYNTKYILYNA